MPLLPGCSSNELAYVAANALADMSSLRFLDLSGNDLLSVDGTLLHGKPLLQRVVLRDNRLASLPTGLFSGCASLIYIDASSNTISRIEAGVFGAAGLPNLYGLDLSNNRLSAMDGVLLPAVPSLAQVDISGNRLTALDPGCFLGLRNLTLLGLHDNRIPGDALTGQLLGDLGALLTLTLQNNPLLRLASGILQPLARVTQLDISNCGLNEVPETVTALPALQILRCSRNRIAAIHAAAFVASAATLQLLELSGNSLTSVPSAALLPLTLLQSLDLSDNSIGVLPARAFVAPGQPSSLFSLVLNACAITTVDGAAFAGLTAMQQLYLQGNSIRELSEATFSESGLLSVLNLDRAGPHMLMPQGLFHGMSKLSQLRLQQVGISTLQPAWFSHLPELEILTLDYNRWATLHRVAIWRRSKRVLLDTC